MKLKSLGITHANCAYCEIDGKYIVEGYSKEDIQGRHEVFIKVLDNYEISNKDSWYPKWESMAALDKDEITSLHLNYDEEHSREIRVPFKNVNSNGAFCENAFSTVKQIGGTIEILWWE